MSVVIVTLTPPQTVERYVALARQRRETGRRQRHSWVACPCILCADVREHLGIKPPAIRIGNWSTEAQAVEVRP